MRKITVSLLLLILILSLSAPVLASEVGTVTDFADILTDQETALLTAYAEEVAEQYHCGVYILIVDDYTQYAWDPYEAAYTVYHDNALGVGPDRDGVILLLSMAERDFAFFVYGPNAEYALNDYGQIQLEEAMLDDLAENRWYDGLEDFIGYCGYALEQAQFVGEPVRESLVPYYLGVWVVAAVIGAVVCLVFYSQMKSARVQTLAHDYIGPEGLHLTQTGDIFTHRTVRRRKIQTSSSGSGSSHSRSGGGGSGRSGKF